MNDAEKPAVRGFDNFDSLPDGAYVSVPAEAAIFGVSVNTAWRWHREGRLPPTVKLSPGCTDTVEDRAALAAIPPCDDSPTELLRLLVEVHEKF